MNKVQKRFLFFCIGSRIFLALSLLYVPDKYLSLLSFILATMSLGFIIIFSFGLRKKGIETGNKKIWWNHMRPIHGVLFIIASYSLFKRNNKFASQVLIIDVVIGLLAWIKNYNLLF